MKFQDTDSCIKFEELVATLGSECHKAFKILFRVIFKLFRAASSRSLVELENIAFCFNDLTDLPRIIHHTLFISLNDYIALRSEILFESLWKLYAYLVRQSFGSVR